mgnify:CR=1 FL=1
MVEAYPRGTYSVGCNYGSAASLRRFYLFPSADGTRSTRFWSAMWQIETDGTTIKVLPTLSRMDLKYGDIGIRFPVLIYDRLINQNPKFTTNGVGCRRHELCHENPDEVFHRIDPETRACSSPPGIFARRSQNLCLDRHHMPLRLDTVLPDREQNAPGL